MSQKELEQVVGIYLQDESEIESLQGIEYFTNLKELYCDNTKVKFLDVPKLKKLETAYFKHTPLEYLALCSENLHDLHVYDTKLDTDGLDCNLKGIKYLNISDTNISEIDLSNSNELRSLFCSNTPISKLDLSNNTKLELLTCDNTSIKELILSDNHEVDAVDARNCNLIAFELSDQYDISDFDEKYEEGLDFGEEGILINFKNQNINTIPNGKTRFDLSEWAPHIDTSRISNLKGATLSGTTLSGFTAGSQITYDYDCGAGYTMNVVINAPKDTSSSASSGGGGGGFILPSAPIQKPTVSAGSGYTTTLGKDGSTLEITLENGYKLDDVLVNGISKGTSLSLTGLKDGDKVEIKVSKEEVSNTEQIKAQLAELTKDNFKARSAQIKLKSGKKAIKITWTNPNGIKFDGVEIFRSSKKNSGYGKKPYYTSKSNKYCNTAIKQGSRYYYKVRGYVEVDGVKYYSAWSAKAWRTVK